MRPRKLSLTLVATAALVSAVFQPSVAQTAQTINLQSAPLAASASTVVPALVPFSGILTEPNGKPLSGETAITFLIFKDQQGGEPLFAETQALTPDASGNYKVQLGATLANGLPTDLFSTGEARWLEVQAAGQTPQPRVLMASVPYALKAADSATLGGLPASAFVLAGSKAAADFAATAAVTTSAANVTTTGGVSGYLPEFSGASTVVDSPLFVNGANVGIGTATPTATLDVNGTTLISGALTANGGATIGGTLLLPAVGTATASAGFSSQPMKFYTSAWNSTSNAAVQPRFEWQAAVTGNDTAAPSATLNLFSSTTSAGATNTGFSFNANGTLNFAKGQTFPGTGTGNGTITSITAGTGLTGGGATGNVTLNVDTTKVPLLGAATNTFTGNQTTQGNLSVLGNETLAGSLTADVSVSTGTLTAGSLTANSGTFTSLTSSGVAVPPKGTASLAFGVNSFPIDLHSSVYGYFDPGPVTTDFRLQAESSYNGTTGVDQNSLNLLFGSTSQAMAETGLSISANGALNAPSVNTSSLTVGQPAGNSISSPAMVIQADDSGLSRNAAQQLSIQGATFPGQQLLIGYLSDASTNSNGGLATIQATWNGYENTALALQPNGGCVCVRTGLDTALAYQSAPFVVGQGQGSALADGWATYSSRRFKTDIHTLTGALDKVEELRGVSYTLKATGKHEIGVIAEEVGKVVPEVVTYEKNGVDAQSVDYTRLTALLIEATKQQQAEIASALREIKSQQTTMRKQAASIARLKAQVQAGGESLRQVKRQLASRQSDQPILVAMR
jgi:hypothetical protein